MSSPNISPTRREFFLTFALFLVLVAFSHSGFGFQSATPTLKIIDKPPAPQDIHFAHIQDNPKPESYRGISHWGRKDVPATKILAHVPGWTIFDNLYIYNGIVYIVTDHPELVPNVTRITSKGHNIENGLKAELAREPTDKEIQIISKRAAKKLFGKEAINLDGVTFFANDPHQFITHYYHWAAELWFGLWRTYSSLDPRITSEGKTTLPPPKRIIFPHLDADHWRDYASMNQWILHASFPSMSYEFDQDYRDRIDMGRPLHLDRVVFGDRSAAMHGFNYLRTQRTASEAFSLLGSVNWWMTIRSNVIQFSGLKGDVGRGTTSNPVITYISRQEWGRRMLLPEAHEGLVRELYRLRDEYGYEVNVVRPEKMSRVEQLLLAARTTILMGVHGNGLTSLVWMKPSPRSTVMEFFFPGGFARDYEYTTRALGMVHYGFWGDSYFTSPQVPLSKYVEGFQGNEIPLDGTVVARLVQERLTLAEEIDD